MLRNTCKPLWRLVERVCNAKRKAVMNSSLGVLRYLCRDEEKPKELAGLACFCGNFDAYEWLGVEQTFDHIVSAIEGDQVEMFNYLQKHSKEVAKIEIIVEHAGGPLILAQLHNVLFEGRQLEKCIHKALIRGNKFGLAFCMKHSGPLNARNAYAHAVASWNGNFIKHLFYDVGLRPLHQGVVRVFIANNDVDGIEWAFANGCVMEQDFLRIACMSPSIVSLKHFIEVHKAEPYQDLLDVAVQSDSVDIFAYLLQKGLRPTDFCTQLIHKASRAEEFLFQLLLL